jgi:hypothetical protein
MGRFKEDLGNGTIKGESSSPEAQEKECNI